MQLVYSYLIAAARTNLMGINLDSVWFPSITFSSYHSDVNFLHMILLCVTPKCKVCYRWHIVMLWGMSSGWNEPFTQGIKLLSPEMVIRPCLKEKKKPIWTQCIRLENFNALLTLVHIFVNIHCTHSMHR